MHKQKNNENDLLTSYENDEWKSVKDFTALKARYEGYARNTTRKNKRINIRLSEQDLEGLKASSLEEGIPYQTLISSLIHKYVKGKIRA
ncbi:MAG: antitoxin [Chlorobiaceae bacterium]